MTHADFPQISGATIVDTWHSPSMGGGGIVVKFPNGWGASIVKHNGSYGGKSGLFEAMALSTSDHLIGEPAGWLTPEDVQTFCNQVASR